jgi:hypothetical protein
VCSINIRGGARGAHTPTHHHMKTVAATSSSWPHFEALTAHEVLAHPCAVFHPCTGGLGGGTIVVAAVLIGYDDVEVAIGMTMRRRRP